MRRSLRRALVAAVAVVAGIAVSYLLPKPLPELSRAQFLDEVGAGHVRSVEIEDQAVILGRSMAHGLFFTRFRRGADAGLIDALRARGIEVRLTKSAPGRI
jgi:hypothetical protein